MPVIRYVPDERDVDARDNETILEVSLRAGIPFAHACGGNARCSTCRVMILDGLKNCAPRNEREAALAAHLQFAPEMRLACQTKISGPICLRRLVLDSEDEVLATDVVAESAPQPAGEEKSVAILFADIRGFTTFSENLLPYDVIHALNRYYHQIGRVIARHGGVIDNYMGDGILAVFGLGENSSHVVSAAIRAGLDMLDVVERLKPYFEDIHGKSFEIGIGLHYGEVIVGSIGTESEKRRTIVGDAVNFASRIESANKNVGTNFLISEAAYKRAGDEVEVNKCPPWDIRGKTGQYHLYEIVRAKQAPLQA
jgi:adenylate cyclase